MGNAQDIRTKTEIQTSYQNTRLARIAANSPTHHYYDVVVMGKSEIESQVYITNDVQTRFSIINQITNQMRNHVNQKSNEIANHNFNK